MLPVERFTRFIEQNQLFEHTDSILAAVSGGTDSVLMAHLLKVSGYSFAIAHCNFALRGAEADADEQFCRQLAQTLGVTFHHIRFDTKSYAATHKLSIQMAARQLRYDWFASLATQFGYKAVALAHHQNDTIETILLNLTRGTGIAGLHGILLKNGNLVRPMLFLSRDEIQDIIDTNQIAFVEDSSNASVKYARNKIRHEVIPKLKELNPALEDTFERNLQHFRELEQLLDMQLAQLKATLPVHADGEIRFPLDKINALQPQHLLLSGLLDEYGFNDATVQDIIDSLGKHSGRTFASNSHAIILDRGYLILTVKNDTLPAAISITPADRQLNYHQYRLTVLHDDTPLIVKDNPLAVSVDAEKLLYPLTVRPWQQKDVFYPLGMKTRQKLSDFFVHQKVPLHQKSQVPLLINGNGDIIWVAGYRPDERYKVSASTKKVTIFELNKLP